MKNWIFLWMILTGITAKAADSTDLRPALEFHAGKVIRPYYRNYTPQVSEAAKEYYFNGGWEFGLALSALLGKHISFSTRWKYGNFGNPAADVAAVFQKEFPEHTIVVGSDKWGVAQLNAGITYSHTFKRASVEVGQYAGLSILKIPYLQVRGYRSPYTEVLIIRDKQKQSMYSLYTTLGFKYQLNRRRHVFARGEFVFHRIKNQQIELATVFGTNEIYNAPRNNSIVTYCVNVGMGWKLGKLR